MQEVKFTKGPWKAELNDDGSFRVTGCGGHNGHPYYVVCSRQKHEINSETHANAHLISAAPELYEALELILETRIQEKGAWNWQPGESPLHDRCKAALAKARGEHQ